MELSRKSLGSKTKHWVLILTDAFSARLSLELIQIWFGLPQKDPNPQGNCWLSSARPFGSLLFFPNKSFLYPE